MNFGAALAIVAALGAPASALAQGMNMSTNAPATQNPADKALMDSMQKMTKDMDVAPTGNADRDFVLMMVPHHQGAIDMAKVELMYGKDPRLLKLARSIVKAQEAEIAEMNSWLKQHPK